MPAPVLTKPEVLDRLMQAFREHGYDGASLAALGAATGLGKSSLYHYFPDGKAQMAREVLAALADHLARELYAPLAATTSAPKPKLDRMLAAIDAFYAGGTRACLLERLAASTDRAAFRRPLADAFTAWIDALAGLAREAGFTPAAARARAEDAVARIEGALVIAGATQQTALFARTLKDIGKTFLAR